MTLVSEKTLKKSIDNLINKATGNEKSLLVLLAQENPIWLPFADADHPERMTPQLMAYLSTAQELYFGGAAGGGKTDLLLGLAMTAHQKSRIYRREYGQLESIVERVKELYDPRIDSLRESAPPSLLTRDGRIIRFDAVQHMKDVGKFQGRPGDLLGFDEISNFMKDQYKFLTIWNRSKDPLQFCQIVCTGNPPTTEEGEWVIDYWAPWLDEEHPDYPAKPGEIRYFVEMAGKTEEVPDGKWRRSANGNPIYPRKRTFIPSKIEDNPVYMQTEYYQMLMSLPDELREKMYEGRHSRVSGKDPFQVIPTEWVRAAMSRWTEDRPTFKNEQTGKNEPVPQTKLGVDPTRGGGDVAVIAKRYDFWIDKLVKHRGEATNNGPKVAGLVLNEHQDNSEINVDVIGIGSSVYDFLKANGVNVSPINVAERSTKRDKTRKFGFINLRSESWWNMREMLDPKNGFEISLPPDKDLRVQLTAPRFEITPRGIKVESKDDIKKRIGRSTDEADAVILTFIERPKPGLLV